MALCAGTILTLLGVIVAGLLHFDSSLLDSSHTALHRSTNKPFSVGLGAAMLVAIYDYLGYYNVCHLGDEVKQPERTIPLAIIVSVCAVSIIYLVMNTAIIGVVPWWEARESKQIATTFMERIYGRNVSVAFAFLIIWTAVACVFAMFLGYSRIPYAAARHGDFFSIFATLHPTEKYPRISLLTLGGITALFCFLELETVVNAAVCVRILIQFIGQIVALHLLRTRQSEIPRPFQMPLYPLPSLIALVGWLYVLLTADRIVLALSAVVMVSGVVAFVIRNRVSATNGFTRSVRSE